MHFHETRAPVVKWNAIRACLTMSFMHNFHARSIDFDQAYVQLDSDADMHLRLPMGFRISNKDRCIMQFIKNVCGLKQGCYNFCEKLKEELIKR